MGRRRNSHRPPSNRDVRHRDRAASKADEQAVVHPGPSRRNEGLTACEPGGRNGYLVLVVCGLLFLAVGLVFAQTVRHEFLNLDDNVYVCENPHVVGGLTAQGISWVFTHEHGGNWHPLTSLSQMFDCQLYGLNAGGHHLTNVLLHAATAILLLLVLWRMTGDFWPAALVAAIFAVHPLRVESVAWVTERKDVLSGLFFMLTLAAYVHYVRRPFSLGRYLLLAVVFALGLMAKQSLVTLPFVLLLLDYWPLRRMTASPTPPHCNGGAFVGNANFLESSLGRSPLRWQLVLEKLPLLLLAAISSMAAVWAASQVLAPVRALPVMVPDGRRPDFVRCLSGPVFLSAGFGGLLPAPRARFTDVEGRRRFRYLGGRYRGGLLRATEISLPARGLAVVLGDAGADDWAGTGGNGGDGRPLHLLAADRLVYRPGVGSGRRVSVITVSSLVVRALCRHWCWWF